MFNYYLSLFVVVVVSVVVSVVVVVVVVVAAAAAAAASVVVDCDAEDYWTVFTMGLHSMPGASILILILI